ncbi:MAG: hypothetical protein RL391_1712, partial [Actinomycetota bacterium]
MNLATWVHRNSALRPDAPAIALGKSV